VYIFALVFVVQSERSRMNAVCASVIVDSVLLHSDRVIIANSRRINVLEEVAQVAAVVVAVTEEVTVVLISLLLVDRTGGTTRSLSLVQVMLTITTRSPCSTLHMHPFDDVLVA